MDVQQVVNDHPVIGLGAFFLLALVLGVLHEITSLANASWSLFVT